VGIATAPSATPEPTRIGTPAPTPSPTVPADTRRERPVRTTPTPAPTPPPVAQTEPAPAPAPVTPPPAPVEERQQPRIPADAQAFAMGRKISVTNRVGPVSMKLVNFKRDKDQLQAELELQCAEGKDQRLTLRIEMLDGDGSVVASLAGAFDVDEGEDDKVKLKQRVGGEAFAAQWFRIFGSSVDN
jgi:hypothetical protein